jgi:hypothetical protein
MHFPSGGSLFASLIISSIGFVLMSYGRKLARPPQLVAGLALLIYPYFVPSVIPMVAVAAAVVAGMWVAVYLGL